MVPFFETALILVVAVVGWVASGMISSKGFQGALLDVDVLHGEYALWV